MEARSRSLHEPRPLLMLRSCHMSSELSIGSLDALSGEFSLFWLLFSLCQSKRCRFTDIVVPQGGADKYLMQRYSKEAGLTILDQTLFCCVLCMSQALQFNLQDDMIGFATWLKSTIPRNKRQGSFKFDCVHFSNRVVTSKIHCMARVEYATDLTPGGKCLHVWNLGFRTDFGLPGMADPTDMALLMELILTQGPPRFAQSMLSHLFCFWFCQHQNHRLDLKLLDA